MADSAERVSRLPRWKQALFAATPAVVTLVIFGTVSEVVLRARYEKVERITGAADWRVARDGELEYFWDQYDPILGWTNEPKYVSDARVPFRVTINAQGLRADRDYTSSPAPGVERIAVFGDSYTFGEEVGDDQTLPRHLQDRLAGSEVLNFGVHGYGLDQMTLRLESEGFTLNPSRVLFVVLLPWDVNRMRVAEFVHPKPVFELRGDGLVVSNVPVPTTLHQSWLVRHCFAAAWLFGRSKNVSAEEATGSRLVDLGRAALRRAHRACSEHGVRFDVLFIVGPEPAEDAGLRTRADMMRESLLDADLNRLDLVDTIRRLRDESPDTFLAPRRHFSGAGNRLVAEQIASYLAHTGPADPK